MQVSRSGLSQNDKDRINSELESFYNTVKRVAPLIIRNIPTYVAASLDNRPAALIGTSIKTVSINPPTRPEVGDLWFNSGKGKYFAYLADGKAKYWVEV
jgi:hypothetical protein